MLMLYKMFNVMMKMLILIVILIVIPIVSPMLIILTSHNIKTFKYTPTYQTK